MRLNLNINGKETVVDALDGETLLEVMRRYGFKGVKCGCGEGGCGACCVLLDGRTVNSCMILAPRAEGRQVTTIEGIGSMRDPHPLQQSFVRHGAVHCGFCTPGFIVSSKALIDSNPMPSRQEVQRALDGNICRCTGMERIIEAVVDAATLMKSNMEDLGSGPEEEL